MSQLVNILNRFAHKPEDSTDLAFEKKLILVIALSCCGCGLAWSLLYYIVFGFGLTAYLPLSFVVIVGSMILISHRMNDHRLLVYTQLACITWISALIQWSIGSVDQSGLVIVWGFLGPFGATIFLSFRQSLLWMVMFIVIVLISVVYEPTFLGDPLVVSAKSKMLFYMMNLGISSIVVFSASAWFVTTFKFERERSETLLQKIKTLFGQHVSSEVANELLHADGKQGSESKSYEVTTMFLDIRDFTLFADSRAPREVANFQNIIFDKFINTIRDNKGIVLQLLGDGLLAVFGAPITNATHPDDSIKAGFAMIESLKNLSDEGQVPEMKMGIGLHTGKVIAGEVGNEYRKSYSITGSNVIVASRIEQLNKKLATQFLISETVYSQVRDKYSVDFQGKHALKGISKAVGIYRLA